MRCQGAMLDDACKRMDFTLLDMSLEDLSDCGGADEMVEAISAVWHHQGVNSIVGKNPLDFDKMLYQIGRMFDGMAGYDQPEFFLNDREVSLS